MAQFSNTACSFFEPKGGYGKDEIPFRIIPRRLKQFGHRHLTQKTAWTVDSHTYRMIFSIIVVLCTEYGGGC